MVVQKLYFKASHTLDIFSAAPRGVCFTFLPLNAPVSMHTQAFRGNKKPTASGSRNSTVFAEKTLDTCKRRFID